MNYEKFVQMIESAEFKFFMEELAKLRDLTEQVADQKVEATEKLWHTAKSIGIKEAILLPQWLKERK